MVGLEHLGRFRVWVGRWVGKGLRGQCLSTRQSDGRGIAEESFAGNKSLENGREVTSSGDVQSLIDRYPCEVHLRGFPCPCLSPCRRLFPCP